MTNNNNKHFEILKSAINFMRFINEYADNKSDILEVFDLISNLTAESDFDFEIVYTGYEQRLDITVWDGTDTVSPYINLKTLSTNEQEEFCNRFDLPCFAWTDEVQIAEKVANGEF
jgi:hypothetical protein